MSDTQNGTVSLYNRLLQEAKDANIDDDPEVQEYLKLVNLAPNDHVKKLYAKKLRLRSGSTAVILSRISSQL